MINMRLGEEANGKLNAKNSSIDKEELNEDSNQEGG